LDAHVKKHGIHPLTGIGLVARTCTEATVRYAAVLGSDFTVVKGATADDSEEMCTRLVTSICRTSPVPL